MAFTTLLALCALPALVANPYGAGYQSGNLDLANYPPTLPYNTPYNHEPIYYDSWSSSSSSEEDRCSVHKMKKARCPQRFKTGNNTCERPDVRRFEMNNREFLEVTCPSGEWQALVTKKDQVITATFGRLEHVFACSESRRQWKTYNATGSRFYVKNAFCVSGPVVDEWIQSQINPSDEDTTEEATTAAAPVDE
ncbi:unnamed protein product, partial [Mesorhabditis spiculigera]